MATGLQQRQWGALVDALYALDAGDPWIGQTIDPSPQPKKAFDPNEPRDDHGEWSGDGSGGGTGSPAGITAPSASAALPAATAETWATAHPDGNGSVFAVAHAYLASAGHPALTNLAPVALSPAEGLAIADAYAASKDDPANAETQAAYAAFNSELAAQRTALEAAGYHYEPWTKAGQPYANSAEMRADVRDNHHLYYFKSTEGTVPNRLMSLTQNDTFRAVHDTFGHAMGGNQFGPKGETNAFVDHSQMFTPTARRALATETIAQNAWFNFGRVNAGKPISQRSFADQKATLLNPSLYEPIIARAHTDAHKGVTRAADVEDDYYFACPAHRRPAAPAKYSDDEARDDHGRWTDSGGQNDVVVPGHPAGPEHGPGSTPVGGTANDTVGPTPTGGAFHADEFFGRLSEADGGFTVQPLTGNEPHGAGNYAVSIYPERGKVFDPGTLTPTDLYAYVRDNAAYFARPDHYLGAWHDPVTGKIYADISVVTQDAQRAADLARTHNQLAYFDLGTLASVRVDSPHLAGHKDARHGAGSEAGDHRRARAPGAIRRRPGHGVHEAVQAHDGPDADAGTGRRAAAADPRRSTVDAILQRAAQAHVFGKQPDTLDLATAPAPTRIAASMEPDLARAITGAFTAAREALDLPALTAAIKDGDHHAAATLVRAAGANDRLKAAYHPRVAAAFLRGAHLAATHLGIVLRATTTLTLDAVHAAALDWASQHAGELVLTDADVQEIINILVQGSVAGEATPQELAVAIRSAIGLLPRQVQATATYQQTLLAAGTAPEVVAARVASYVDEQIASRAMTISRTELIGALNGGQQELWNQAVSDGTLDPAAMQKVWIVTDDERLCPICADLDGEQVAIGDEFSSGDMTPPSHVACRCSVGLVRAEDDSAVDE